jgi:hypothetical protein
MSEGYSWRSGFNEKWGKAKRGRGEDGKGRIIGRDFKFEI